GCSAGTAVGSEGNNRFASVHNALSADGSKLYWTASGSGSGAGKIYLRENPGQPQAPGGTCKANRACTVPVSEEAELDAGSSASRFLAAARDGSKAFILTGNRLYEYSAATGRDTLIAGQIPVGGSGGAGLMGESESGLRIYFASDEVLSTASSQAAAPVAGKPNLYIYDGTLPEGDRVTFVMTLAESDVDSPFSPISSQAINHAGYVSPDGLHAAFVSSAPPPDGYDNRDVVSGKADAEVYVYDATALGGGGQLFCVSCNPTGARPAGMDLATVESRLDEFWSAAQIPAFENNLHAPSPLSVGGGRVFFEASDALSPLDSNGVTDVYEWEAPGVGTCTAE